MEPKKSKKANLENKRGLFFQIGMATALMLMIGVFASSQSEKGPIVIVTDPGFIPDPDIINVVPPKPPVETSIQPLVVNPTIINVVPDTHPTINQIIDWNPTDIPDLPALPPVEVPIEGNDPVYTAEFMPEFQGGDLGKFRNWVMGKVVYPQIALDNGIQGRVTLTFVIETDGRLTNIEVLSSPDRALSDEAIRVLGGSPDWTPGKQGTRPVRVRFNLPLDFQLK